MRYQVVAFDLDGTLLNSDRLIAETSQQAIETLKQHDIKVVLVTGRHHVAVRAYHHQLQLDTPVICCNGTYLYDFANDEVLRADPMPRELARQALDIIRRRPLNSMLYVQDAMVYEQSDPHIEALIQWAEPLPERLRPVFRQHDFDPLLAASQTQVWKYVVSAPTPEQMQATVTELEQELALSCEWSWSNRVDVAAAGNSKGNRLRELLAHWQIESSQLLAFGDNHNDSSLLTLAGGGVAMGNAVDALKAQADFVTDSNDENGIANGLRHFFPELLSR